MKKSVKVWLLVLVFLEIAAAVWMAGSIAGEEKYSQILDGGEIFADSGEGRIYGALLDSENAEEYSVLRTEDLSLKKGIYNIEIVYSSTDGGTVNLRAEGENPQNMWADTQYLSNMDSVKTFSIWANDLLESFRIEISSNGGKLGIQKIKIETANNSALYRIVCLFLRLLLLNLPIFLYCFRARLQRYGVEIMGLLGITLLASVPMLTRYYLPGHDLVFHLLRIEGLKEGLLSGVFPVRIQPNWNNGYGYAVSIMYGDTTLFLPAVMRLIGFTVKTSYKTFVIAVNFATAAIAFGCFQEICHNKYDSLLGSLLYTAAPYRLVDIYIRGSFGEYTAMMFFPLIALGFWYAFAKEPDSDGYGKKLFLPVAGFSGLIQTHVLSCQLAAIFIVLLCLLAARKVFRRKTFFYLAKILVFTVLANLWFIIPFLIYFREDLNCTVLKKMEPDFQMLGVSITELLAPAGSRYYGYSWSELTSLSNKFSIPFSNGLLLCGAFGLCCMLKGKLKENKIPGTVLLLGGLSLWMGTNLFPYSSIQRYFPALAAFLAKPGLPYRYLSLACLFLTLFLVILFAGLDEKKISPALIGIAYFLIAVTGTFQSLSIAYDSLYTGNMSLCYDGGIMDTTELMGQEYLYQGTDTWPTYIDKTVAGNNVEIQDSRKQYGFVEADCRAAGKEAYLEIPLFYYPGYAASGVEKGKKEELEIIRGGNNRIRVLLPEGFSGKVTVAFQEPVSWRIAEVVSAVTFVLLAAESCFGTSRKRRDWQGEREDETVQ